MIIKQKRDVAIARDVLRLRLSQLIINEKYKTNDFKIPIHIAIGHEAIAVAINAILQKNDLFVGTHRNMHYNLARAKVLKPILDEYFLKKEGLAGAELGSMNLVNPEKNIVYASSILGNNLPVATGLALRQKVKNNGGLVVVQTGDGAMEEGAFYESLLFMKSNSLAALIIVENNEWSMHTKIPERRSPIDIQKFTEALGVNYKRLTGNDPYHYIEELKKIRGQILKTKTPAVLEVYLCTLGGWNVKNPDGSDRFIHPHAGPLPKTQLTEWPEVEHSNNDPVFVLSKYFSFDKLKKMSRDILKKINEEIE